MPILKYILEVDPVASIVKAELLSKVWGDVVGSIIEEMLARAKTQMGKLHIDLREEMVLELSKLEAFISKQVVADRMGARVVEDIDPQVEREKCFGLKGKERISNTAQNYLDAVWLPKYVERWKPKTEAALRKEKKQGKRKKAIPTKQVEESHFIPKSFIKRYWSKGQYVYRSVKTPLGLEKKKKIPLGSWGYRKNLYSDNLEAYFALLEGDAVRPIQMILNVEPLNRPQREALIGFMVIQRLRNPHFMEKVQASVSPVVVSEVGTDKAEDKLYMRTVYETLYSQNSFYDKLARPIMYSRWVVVRSETPDFVLPDVCNLIGSYENRQYVVMSLTPRDCLIVLPIEVNEPRIVPHYITAAKPLVEDISFILRCAAIEEFLSDCDASFVNVEEEPNSVIQRVVLALSKITADG